MLKAYAIGFLGAVLAILIAAGIWLATQPKDEEGLLWGGTVYTTKEEFKGYLKSKGLSYKVWLARNPGAAPWEPPVERAATPTPASTERQAAPETPAGADDDEASGVPLTVIALILAAGSALLLLLRGGPAIAAAAAALAPAERRLRAAQLPRPSQPPRPSPVPGPPATRRQTPAPQRRAATFVVARPVERAFRSDNPRRDPPPAPVEPPAGTAAPQAELPVAEAAAPRHRPAESIVQACEIRWWRGYVKGQFYVEADRVLESKPFRARGDDTPERNAEALAAYDELVAQLVSAGWERDGRGPHWFSDRFRKLT